MQPNREGGFLDDLLYFNSLVLWDTIPEETCFRIYERAWLEYGKYTTQSFGAEKQRMEDEIDAILSRASVLDMVIPCLQMITGQSSLDKPLVELKGEVESMDGLRMNYDEKKNVTSIFLIVPPGVTDGKAFAATIKRKSDALHRFRRHQFELYYRYDMRLRALKLARVCRETLPEYPEFKLVTRFDRRASDEGGRPRNWYQEVSRVGTAMNYFSSRRQNQSIRDLQDFIAENNREPVQRQNVGEDLKRTCRKWGISLWAGMGLESYKSAVGSVWKTMQGSSDPQVQRAVERFKAEQKKSTSNGK